MTTPGRHERDNAQLSGRCAFLYEKVAAALRGGRLRDAAFTCRELCETFPGFARGWHLGSEVALQLGNGAKALEYIERAIAIEPGNDVFRVRRAQLLLNERRLPEARAALAGLDPQEPAVLTAVGNVHLLMNEYDAALACYQRAAVLVPGDAGNCFNLATTLRYLGRLEEAEQAYDDALRADPNSYEAYYLRAGLRRQTPERNHVAALEAALAAGIEAWKGEVQVCYALAKEYEDLGDYQRSFAALRRGADRQRANMQYDVQDDVRTIDAIISTYSAGVCAQPVPGCRDAEPIFVLGLPRTGTTLVDRILSSHSAVTSAGELNDFAIEMMKLIRAGGAAAGSKTEAIAASLQLDFAQLGANYLRAAAPRTGGVRHFIDKMPLNYLYCGLIARALPDAKIIQLVRHPLDTCYAIYKQLFTLAYPFSYDLDDLAEYYCAYTRLMRHWHAVLPGRIHTMSYEALVADQEGESRRLLEFCELPWEDACLHFERNTAASTTASAAQVRQPIYRSSLAKWKKVERELQPLIGRLRERGELDGVEL